MSAVRWRRILPWALLVALLGVAQTLLLALTVQYEHDREQERTEMAAAAAAGDVRQLLARNLQSLQALLWNDPPLPQWRADAADLLHARRELVRLEWRGAGQRIEEAVDSPYRPPVFSVLPRSSLAVDSEAACATAMRLETPTWSRSYFVPQIGGLGLEVIDVCLPTGRGVGPRGAMAATIALAQVLDEAVTAELARSHELTFVEGDGTRLARGGRPRGAGVFVAERLIDLPGTTLVLRLDSAGRAPGIVANLPASLVLGLSLALAVVVALLVRDVRRRAAAEQRLAEELALRQAMENSLVTGLRARDMAGRITYVNPAFCSMVGFAPEQLIGQTTPPYWPPEMRVAYEARHAQRLERGVPAHEQREGHETTFMRANGERFPVLIFEAPLIGTGGVQSGWMSAVLDLTPQKRVEELSRQQQEQLQATARLATVGEMASLLSHELNQPLAAIASYASGSLNLMAPAAAPDAPTLAMVREATQRIAEQAERAGRVIKSVHDFVRRRERSRDEIACEELVETVLPLLRLQARKSAALIELDLGGSALRVACDRTMVEQVLLNLTRNAIQAMESMPPERRVLQISARAEGAWVRMSVTDQGPGIAPEVGAKLFTPFFTTKAEGMGLGLSLCRTVIEQHGGALGYELRRDARGGVTGTRFSFTLPAAAAQPATSEPVTAGARP
ncbi:MAG TPA: ATP-binding protein [Methylibium sp.]|nr:ATP-binding protein [Methylibium sp.]